MRRNARPGWASQAAVIHSVSAVRTAALRVQRAQNLVDPESYGFLISFGWRLWLVELRALHNSELRGRLWRIETNEITLSAAKIILI